MSDLNAKKPLSLIVNKMDNAFDHIGHKNSTVLPTSKNNQESLVQEYFVAHRLAKRGDNRKRAAMKAMVQAGIVPDVTKKPLPGGTVLNLFAGETVILNLSVNNGSDMVDPQGLIADLHAAGVSKDIIAKCIEKNTKHRRGQHIFMPMLVGSGIEED